MKYFWQDSSTIPSELYTRNFSLIHIIWFLSLTFIVLAFLRFYRMRTITSRDTIKKVLAVLLVLCEISVWIWKLIIGQYYLKYSLPLHLCGISIFLEFIAVFGKRQVILKEFTYALSMPGAIAALTTPDWNYPFLSFQYIELVLMHTLLVLIPVLIVWGDGFKPDYHRLPKVSAVFVVTISVAVAANTLFGGNYMFLASAPAGTTLDLFAKLFGAHTYLLPEFILLLIIWSVLYLPRILIDRRKQRRQESSETENEYLYEKTN